MKGAVYDSQNESVFQSLNQVVCTRFSTWRWLSWLAANGAVLTVATVLTELTLR